MTDTPQTFPDRPLTKEEFLQRYTLLMVGQSGGLRPSEVVNDAVNLWIEIKKVTPHD